MSGEVTEPLKRYLLFCYPDFYPCGGWLDFIKSFDTVMMALVYVRSDPEERLRFMGNTQLIDGTTGLEVDINSGLLHGTPFEGYR